jgi:hypothetical protein
VIEDEILSDFIPRMSKSEDDSETSSKGAQISKAASKGEFMSSNRSGHWSLATSALTLTFPRQPLIPQYFQSKRKNIESIAEAAQHGPISGIYSDSYAVPCPHSLHHIQLQL